MTDMQALKVNAGVAEMTTHTAAMSSWLHAAMLGRLEPESALLL